MHHCEYKDGWYFDKGLFRCTQFKALRIKHSSIHRAGYKQESLFYLHSCVPGHTWKAEKSLLEVGDLFYSLRSKFPALLRPEELLAPAASRQHHYGLQFVCSSPEHVEMESKIANVPAMQEFMERRLRSPFSRGSCPSHSRGGGLDSDHRLQDDGCRLKDNYGCTNDLFYRQFNV